MYQYLNVRMWKHVIWNIAYCMHWRCVSLKKIEPPWKLLVGIGQIRLPITFLRNSPNPFLNLIDFIWRPNIVYEFQQNVSLWTLKVTFTNYSQLKGQTVDLIAVVGVIVLMHFAAQKSSDIGKRGICAKREVKFGNNRSFKHPMTIRLQEFARSSSHLFRPLLLQQFNGCSGNGSGCD